VRSIGQLLLLLIPVTVAGCATLRLNGCTKLAVCGDRGAYNCGGDLVCASANGETLASEPFRPTADFCRICHGR
jgi:hypothetical protein